jgi:hypothetical protein
MVMFTPENLLEHWERWEDNIKRELMEVEWESAELFIWLRIETPH